MRVATDEEMAERVAERVAERATRLARDARLVREYEAATWARVEALMEATRDLLSDCMYCHGTGELGGGWASYQRYKAPDGSCAHCHDVRSALTALRAALNGEEGADAG